VFPETQASVQAIWDLVIEIEVPDERDAYEGFAYTPVFDCVEVFNDYWACYGWHLNVYEDDAAFPEDVDVITPGARSVATKGSNL